MSDTDNIYAPPQTQPELQQSNQYDFELASRGSRFGAAFLDGIIMVAVIIPIQFFAGVYERMISQRMKLSTTEEIAYGLLGVVVFFLLNGKFLASSGQTIGKKAAGIKIVDMEGNLPTFSGHLLKRYATYFVIGNIPGVGPLLSLVNILFIFRSDKRCLHDLAGGTQVVVKR